MINECSRDDDIEKKKLIKYAADWWAGQIMLKKAIFHEKNTLYKYKDKRGN